MKKIKTIESQLDCKATASLQEQIDSELDQQDKSLSLLLEDTKKDVKDEAKSSG
jgi:hypothetical protein